MIRWQEPQAAEQDHPINTNSTMRIFILTLCSVLLSAQQVVAQQKLVPTEAVARAIEPGKTDPFSVSLNDGDYVTLSLAQRGKVNFMILNPDGSVLRRGEGPPGDAKNSFAFAAEGGGLYSIKITNPGEQPARYELLLEESAVVARDVITIGGQLERAEGARIEGEVVNNVAPNIELPNGRVPPAIPDRYRSRSRPCQRVRRP